MRTPPGRWPIGWRARSAPRVSGTAVRPAASNSGMDTISVDPTAMRTAAKRLDAAADILAGALGTHLRDVRSGGHAVGRLIDDVGQWTRAAGEFATLLRHGADRYRDGESAAAAALR